MPTYHNLIVACTMQPSESSRNTERASTTVSCSHTFEEGVLQIQIALSKAGGWWEGGNTSSVDLLHTMESHSITQIKPGYKQHTPYTKTHRESALSISLSLDFFFCSHFFSLLFFLSPAHVDSNTDTLLPIGTLGSCLTS